MTGFRLLVVEDEYFLATEVADELSAAGAVVVGPVGSVDDTLGLIGEFDTLDGAVLDVNLRGKMIFPVADELIKRNVQCIFVTGYDQSVIPERFATVKRCQKPFDAQVIVQTLLEATRIARA